MQWVTRAGAKTDRVACPWLIRRFIDKEAAFLFVPKEQVLGMARQVGGKSFDAPGADYTHRGNLCTFEVLIEDFKLEDPVLKRLAQIVHGADIEGEVQSCPESAGLLAIAQGFHEAIPDDQEKLRLQFPIYDALYAWARKTKSV
ncbi:MAG: chromate resistance protein [Elusimicrobia bacterium]|nr:chromate resistance protein [Elusimicrobiota bacterium]